MGSTVRLEPFHVKEKPPIFGQDWIMGLPALALVAHDVPLGGRAPFIAL